MSSPELKTADSTECVEDFFRNTIAEVFLIAFGAESANGKTAIERIFCFLCWLC